ncbi:MAG: antitoxin component YwqK of YwqJK toxin-antitoxin module [Crocinitomicaceae bacterium]|jgi:antitoxin component YwqK of YwqJK toxin-antitoxin module
MKIVVVLFCLISLNGLSQKDTCITEVGTSPNFQRSQCGRQDRKGRWHGDYSELSYIGTLLNSCTRSLLHMRHGKKHGKAEKYFKVELTGFQKVEETHYRRGKETGKYTLWDRQNHLVQEGRHRNDYDVGMWTSYDSSGAVLWWKKYKNKHAYSEKRFYRGTIDYYVVVDTKKKIREEHYYDSEGVEIDIEAYRKIWKKRIRDEKERK